MRIVVVGAGKFGYSVANLLSKGQFDVVVVESDENRRNIVKNTLDVLTILGNGCSEGVLNMPEVRQADVCVACTDSDEVNMIGCFLAKAHGIKYTVAQIRSTDYDTHAQELLHKEMKIDLALNPERILANEIRNILETPAALAINLFADGKISLFEVKITADSDYVNASLRDIHLPTGILIAMIFRSGTMIIPHGGDMLKPGDNVYFVGKSDAVSALRGNFNSKYKKTERVLIIGASRTAKFLLPILEALNIFVKIIDINKEKCQQMIPLVNNGMVLCGDGTDFNFLEDEGIADADVVLCLTDNDKMNLLFAMIAKHLGARKTITRVARGEYVGLMEEAGVDITLSARLLSAGEVLKFIRREVLISLSLLEGAQAEMMELKLPAGSPLVGKALLEADLPRECLVCAMVHDNEAFVPNGNTILAEGDRVIIFAQSEAVMDIMALFPV